MGIRARLLLALCAIGVAGNPAALAVAPAKAPPAAKPAAAAPRTTAATAKAKASASTRAPTKVSRTRAKKPPRWPVVELFHINRRETLRLRIADEQGRPIRGTQKRVDQFLRCHHTNAKTRMNPRLTRLIYEAGRHWSGKRVEVVSGYRHPKVAKNPHSPHMKGAACDFRISGVKNSELRDYLRSTFPRIGVGYYPNSSFVHLDVRPGPSAFWIDYSGPGEGAMYSEDARADIKTGRADSFKPAKIDPSWADDDEAWQHAEGGPGPAIPPQP